MKKKFLAVLIAFVMCVAALPTTVFTAMAESVTPADITPDYTWYSVEAETYTISSIEQLVALGKITNGTSAEFAKTDFAGKTVKLGASLTFADNQFWYYNDGQVVKDYRIGNFAGAFDGQNFTISRLKFHNSKVDFNANMYLFATITAGGSVSNLTLDTVTANVNGYDNFGFIAKTMNGVAANCHVKNVTVVVDVHKPNGNGYISSSGAMFGSISCATVTDCTAENIKFTCYGSDNSDNVGALIGYAEGAAKQEATPDTEEVPEKRSTIKNCSVKDVTFDFTRKTKRTGGFIGNTSRTDIVDCTITNLNISVDTYYQGIGGFVGTSSNSTHTNCKVDGFKMSCGDTATIAGDVGGFIGTCGSNVVFKNSSVVGLDMDLISDNNGWGNGGFIGWQTGSNIVVDECSASGEITVVGSGIEVPVGGFVGYSGNASIEFNECVADVNISSNGTVGGLVGTSAGGTLNNCEVTGSVTSTNGVAGGLVGYAQSGANITFVGNNIPSENISGVITSEVANTPNGEYDINADVSIDFIPQSYLCYGKLGGANMGFNSVQEAVDTGANTVTLLADSTESFVLDRTESDAFTLALGEFTYNGVITVIRNIKSFTATGTSEGNSIVVTEPFKDHNIFKGWCSGDEQNQNLATKVEGGYQLTVGETYHTHWEVSDYEHLTFEQLHPNFGTMSYAGDVPAAQEITFTKQNATEADKITGVVVEADYFDISFDGLTLTLRPKTMLNVGTHEEIIHVIMTDNSTHGVTATVTVEKAQAVINVDTSDIVAVESNEWQLPTATTNVGAEIKVDKTVDDMKEVGVYTVTYTVEETDNYFGDQKQIKVTVIMNPTAVQENLDKAIEKLNTAINTKASAEDLKSAINDLDAAYKLADTTLQSALQGKIDVNTTEISNLQTALTNAESTLEAAIKTVQDNLDKAVAELEKAISDGDKDLQGKIDALTTAYQVADTAINSEIVKLQNEDTAIKQSVTDLKTALANAKSELEKLVEDTKTELQGKIDEVKTELEKAKTDLSTAIAQNKTDLTKEIEALKKAMEDANNLINGKIANLENADTAIKADIAALENELAKAKTDLQTAIDKVASDLEAAKSELNAAITNGDSALDEKITALDQAYKTADTLIKGEIAELVADDEEMSASITALETSLASVKSELEAAIAQVQKNLDDAKAELETAIAQNKTDLTDEIANLKSATEAADAVINSTLAGLATEDTAIKASITELTGNLADAKSELETLIASTKTELQGKIDEVKTELEKAKTDLNTAIAQNKTDLTKEIEALRKAMEDADNLINGDIADLENADTAIKADIAALESSLAKAKTDLETAIAKVQSNLDTAVENLNNAIAQNKTDLTAEIKAVENALTNADSVLDGKITDLVGEDTVIKESISALESTLTEAKAELKTAIDTVAKNLETAKSELNTAIVNGDSALDEKLTALDQAYKTADALINGTLAELVANDEEMSASLMALENSLTAVKSVLEAAIADVQTNLNLAKAELAQKDAELDSAIESLDATVTVLIVVICIVGTVAVGSAAAVSVLFIRRRKI